MLATWSNEQAIREIYLKPFEMSVKDADCHAVMSSFNYIGSRWLAAALSCCRMSCAASGASSASSRPTTSVSTAT